ncbi:MAG: hypothetical protein GPJ54_19835 [Candidatus Heimdallarchaeota archaeon]|nr:hypothetical protein [Candidatus Heimdallarchaeota archaeon]
MKRYIEIKEQLQGTFPGYYLNLTLEEIYFLLANPVILATVDLKEILYTYPFSQNKTFIFHLEPEIFLNKFAVDLLTLAKDEKIDITGSKILLNWLLNEDIRNEMKEYFDPTEVFETVCGYCEYDEEHEDGYCDELTRVIETSDFNNIWIVKRFLGNKDNVRWFQEFIRHIWDKTTNMDVIFWVLKNRFNYSVPNSLYYTHPRDFNYEFEGIVTEIEYQPLLLKIFKDGIDRGYHVIVKIEDKELLFDICANFHFYYPEVSFGEIGELIPVFMTCFNKLSSKNDDENRIITLMDRLNSEICVYTDIAYWGLKTYVWDCYNDYVHYDYTIFENDIRKWIRNMTVMSPDQCLIRWKGLAEIIIPLCEDQYTLIYFHRFSSSLLHRKLARQYITDLSLVDTSYEEE